MRDLPVLYTRSSKGAIYQWEIYTEGPNVITEYGQLGSSKIQRTTKVCVGKNLGKKNETSPADQAISEAKSKHTKQVKLEYQLTPELAKSFVSYLPMTAESFEDFKDRTVYPVSVQPKLDGCRAIARWKDNKVVLISRGNEEWEFPWIADEIASFLPKDAILDGELYCHGLSFEQIESLVSKVTDESREKIQFHVYDVPMFNGVCKDWKSRAEDLYSSGITINIQKAVYCTLVSNIEASSENDVFDALKLFENEGYEGAMVRYHDGVYEFNNRSRKLLKVKSFVDSEYPITGFKTGVGKFEQCVVWECTTPEGKTFDVVQKGSLGDKKTLLDNADSYLGKQLKVKYFGLTVDGIPRFPVGVGIRIEKDIG